MSRTRTEYELALEAAFEDLRRAETVEQKRIAYAACNALTMPLLDRYYLKSVPPRAEVCPECQGYGFTEQRVSHNHNDDFFAEPCSKGCTPTKEEK